jgi:sterol 3beta-glucosyltransferase
MKIIVTAVGSTGDIQSFVALAESLKKAGHTVKVCSYDIYKRKFDKISVPFAAVGPVIDENRISEVRDNLKQLSPLKQLDYLVNDVFLYQGKKFYEDCIEASKGYHFGICHSLDFIGQHVMIQNRIPWASVILTPGIIPTDYSSPMFLPDMGKSLNRTNWYILSRVKSGSERKIQQYLSQLNGVGREINALGTFSPYLNLVACSKHLNAIYPDLPGNFVVTGGWYVREGIYNPPLEIINFVENGLADVVFTLGSMEKEEGEKHSALFLKTIELAGIKGIIQQGWAGELPKRPSENALFVDFNMPHHYLFRQTKIVVHSGGGETTLEACKAGAVSITIPVLPDQKYWGKIIYKAGVGSKPIISKQLTPKLLANKIHKTLMNRKMRQNAQTLASQVREEEGTKTAVKAIEDIVYHIK